MRTGRSNRHHPTRNGWSFQGHDLNGLPTANIPIQRSREYRSWLVALILVLSAFGYQALAPSFQYLGGEDNTLSILMRVLIITAAAAVIAARRFNARELAPFWPLLCFMLAFTIRLLENYFVRDLPVYMSADRMFLLWIGGSIIPSVALMLSASLLDQRKVATSMGLLGLIFLIFTLLQSDEIFFSGGTRASLEKLNPISMCWISLVFAAFAGIKAYRDYRISARIVYLILFAGLLGLALMTGSRGPFVAIAASVLIIVAVAPGRQRRTIAAALVAVVLLVVVGSLASGKNLVEPVASRIPDMFENSGNTARSSAAAREAGWSTSVEQFSAHPLLGDKVYEEALYFYPHQMLLEALISVGFLGTCFLLAHIYAVWRATKIVLRQPAVGTGDAFVVMSCWFALITAQFSGSLVSASGFWPLSVVLIARAMQLRQHRSVLRNPSVLRPAAGGPWPGNAGSRRPDIAMKEVPIRRPRPRH